MVGAVRELRDVAVADQHAAVDHDQIVRPRDAGNDAGDAHGTGVALPPDRQDVDRHPLHPRNRRRWLRRAGENVEEPRQRAAVRQQARDDLAARIGIDQQHAIAGASRGECSIDGYGRLAFIIAD